MFFSQHNVVVSPSSLLIVVFWCFLLFIFSNDYNHLVVCMIALEITLLSDQIIDIYHDCFSPGVMALFCRHPYWFFILKFLCHYSSQMSANTSPYCCIHWNYLYEPLYYRHISSLFSPKKMASFHCHRSWLIYIEVFYDSLSRINATTFWDKIFQWE